MARKPSGNLLFASTTISDTVSAKDSPPDLAVKLFCTECKANLGGRIGDGLLGPSLYLQRLVS